MCRIKYYKKTIKYNKYTSSTTPNLSNIFSTKIDILPNYRAIDAQQLIYKTYVDEMKWIPALCNPSNLCIETTLSGNILTDDFDSCTTWIGAISPDNVIVGCVRFAHVMLYKKNLK